MPYSPVVTPRSFLEAHLLAHPEDASTLGIAGHGALLPDPSPRAGDEERARCRAVLDAVPAETDDLDLDAVRRVALFHERYAAQDRNAPNLEPCALPNAMLQHAALHAKDDADWEAIAERAAKVPAYHATHAENLRRGVVDEDVAQTFRDRLL